MKAPYIISKGSVTLILNGKRYTADDTHISFEEIKEAVLVGDYELVPDLINTKKAIERKCGDKIVIKEDQIFYEGEPLHNYVVDRILQFIDEEAEVAYLLNFVERLMLNPSKRAIDELYKFLEHQKMPIDEDGYFYSYKGVQMDYFSCHSGKETLIEGTRNEEGKIFNGVGETIRFERRDVCDDANKGCSMGLHVGSMGYAKGFAPIMVICKVDPADVVSVPHDCSHMKLRTCAYEVTAKADGEMSDTTCEKNNPYNDDNDGVEDWYDDGEG